MTHALGAQHDQSVLLIVSTDASLALGRRRKRGDAALARNFVDVMRGADVSQSSLHDGILSAAMCLAARDSEISRRMEPIRMPAVPARVHVSLALLGYAAFVVGAGYAFLFLQLYRDLKAGRFSTFYGKLPPLEVLERMMLGALWVGFVALTGAVATGALYAEQLYHNAWMRDPKILVTLATWVLYALALTLRRLRHWKGRQTAIASLAGLCAILFSLVAVNFFFTDFHGFL